MVLRKKYFFCISTMLFPKDLLAFINISILTNYVSIVTMKRLP
jgi:hypothetical protein